MELVYNTLDLQCKQQLDRVNAVAGNQKIVECEVVSAGHNVSWGSKRPASTLQKWSGEEIVQEVLQLGRSSAVVFIVLL